MASLLVVLLSLALIGVAIAAPATTTAPGDQETTTAGNEEVALVEELVVVELVPVIVPIVEDTTTAAPEEHKIAKRDAFRGDNPSNDLLADLDGFKYENGLNSLDGRRIKFLPTWAG